MQTERRATETGRAVGHHSTDPLQSDPHREATCFHTPEHPVGRHPGVQPKCWMGVGDEVCFLTHLHKQWEDSVIGNASTCFFLANAYGDLIGKE